MGLDQYLSKHTYVKNWSHTPDERKHKITVKQDGKVRRDIKLDRISYIVEEVGYWRKANQIHRWFVDNCQEGVDDCRDAYVSTEQLKELLDVCKKVMGSITLVDAKVQNGCTYKDGVEVPCMEDGKKIKCSARAKKLLPVSSGFFFGGQGYDEWYTEDIKHTIEILEDVLSSSGSDAEFRYHSSW
jgi:hypothetical protein